MIILCSSGVFNNGKDLQTLLDDEGDMSPDGEAIVMVIPDWSRPQESRPAAPDIYLIKRGVLARPNKGWFDGLITRKSQERMKVVFDYRVHPEADQSVRSRKIPLAACSTENSAAGGEWFVLEVNGPEKTRGTVGRSGRNYHRGGTKAGGGRPAVSRRGRALRPNVRHSVD